MYTFFNTVPLLVQSTYIVHVMQLFCYPKYSILYGALMIFVVGSGQE